MIFKEIIEQSKDLNVYEKRNISEEEIEVVIYNNEIEKWIEILVNTFGSALKPAGEKPGKEAMKLTKDFGGVWEEQTLFKKEEEGKVVIAMFWPWQAAPYTTLKIFPI